MKIDQLQAIWLLLERSWLEKVVRRGPEPVFATAPTSPRSPKRSRSTAFRSSRSGSGPAQKR